MGEGARILVVEDNKDLAFGLQTNLEVQGYDVMLANDGAVGLQLALSELPDMVILDLMLPKLDGINVLKKLRKQNMTMPILVLTAKGNEVDKVLGLRLGADDYVTKPFALMELMARIEALLRRSGTSSRQKAALYKFGHIEVHTDTRQVLRNNEVIELTPKEYGLLVALLGREGRVASRFELMQEVWGHSSAIISRTVDTHIAELRRKLEDDPAQPLFIVTLRKSGYRFVADNVRKTSCR